MKTVRQNYLSYLHSIIKISNLVVILVGFEEIFTSVDEGIGAFDLCVRIFNDPSFLPLNIEIFFSLDLATVSGSASKLTKLMVNIAIH